MQTHKILCLLIIQALVNKSLHTMQLQKLPEDLLIKILSSAKKIGSTSRACKQLQKINSKIFNKNWSLLKPKRDKLFISLAIDRIDLPKEKPDTVHLNELKADTYVFALQLPSKGTSKNRSKFCSIS